MVLNKFAAALLQLAVLVLGAVQAALIDGITATEVWQLIALGAGAAGTFFLPIVDDAKWKGVLKTGSAVAAAVAAAVVPLVGGAFDANAMIIVVLAFINALAVETGVQMRTVAEADARPAGA